MVISSEEDIFKVKIRKEKEQKKKKTSKQDQKVPSFRQNDSSDMKKPTKDRKNTRQTETSFLTAMSFLQRSNYKRGWLVRIQLICYFY